MHAEPCWKDWEVHEPPTEPAWEDWEIHEPPTKPAWEDWEIHEPPIFYPTFELHKSSLVGKKKGIIALTRIYTLSDSREPFEELYLDF